MTQEARMAPSRNWQSVCQGFTAAPITTTNIYGALTRVLDCNACAVDISSPQPLHHLGHVVSPRFMRHREVQKPTRGHRASGCELRAQS